MPVGNVKVASFNVLNFFTTFTDGTTAFRRDRSGLLLGMSLARSNCRGANNWRRSSDSATRSWPDQPIDADVLGLMEMQNNGDTAVSTWSTRSMPSPAVDVYAVVPRRPPPAPTPSVSR